MEGKNSQIWSCAVNWEMLGKAGLSRKRCQELKYRTRGDTLGRTVSQESAVGEGVQHEITRKAGWGQGPEGTGYQAKECTLYPRCRLGLGKWQSGR